MAWGFYGHRMSLYRAALPHEGFHIMLDWVRRIEQNYFVFTSNVDGHFQRTGFSPDRIHECHGSFEFLQCSEACTSQLWSAAETEIEIDEESFTANYAYPQVPHLLRGSTTQYLNVWRLPLYPRLPSGSKSKIQSMALGPFRSYPDRDRRNWCGNSHPHCQIRVRKNCSQIQSTNDSN